MSRATIATTAKTMIFSKTTLQSGEKRPASGLSDRVDKSAKTQQGLLQFFGQKGKEAMK